MKRCTAGYHVVTFLLVGVSSAEGGRWLQDCGTVGRVNVPFNPIPPRPAATPQPSSSPSVSLVVEPTSHSPSSEPSSHPSGWPSISPSGQPTEQGVVAPSAHPSARPSLRPSNSPAPTVVGATRTPTSDPSVSPSGVPSTRPSSVPSNAPSSQPSLFPSNHPSAAPTIAGGASIQCAYDSLLPELTWTTNCPGGDYDYFATLYFCQDTATNTHYGFRLAETDPCSDFSQNSPLIRMTAGSSYQLRLVNPDSNTASTNIHTHGLHIPGSGNTDDITRHVDPGNCLFYNWTIPAEHMDGTFWYHAHIHEHTFDQVNGGALGMLLIEKASTSTETRPLWTERPDYDRFLLLSTNAQGGGRDPTLTDYVNGQSALSISLIDGYWHRLRIAVADPEAAVREIHFDSTACTTHIAAQDGVWRNTVPNPVPTDTISLSGANRIDLAIRCTAASGLWYRTTDTATTALVTINLCDNDGTVEDDGLEDWTPDRPIYLTDLRDSTVDESFAITDINTDDGINGVLWDQNVPLATLTHDTIQEWTLSDTRPHPFHLHLYHMQIVSPGGCGYLYDEGEWFDSISASTDTPCVVRFHTEGIGGRTVMHCHILRHEDDGVMGWVQIDNAPANGEDHIDQTAVCASECYATTAARSNIFAHGWRP